VLNDDADIAVGFYEVTYLGTGGFVFIHVRTISGKRRLVKGFFAGDYKIILALESNRDSLTFLEDAASPGRVRMDNRDDARLGDLDRDHVIVYNVNDAKQRSGKYQVCQLH